MFLAPFRSASLRHFGGAPSNFSVAVPPAGRVLRSVSLIAVLSLGPASLCVAQLADGTRTRLTETFQTARTKLGQRPLPSYDQAEADVLRSSQAVEDYFRPITRQENLDRWKQHLALDDLHGVLQSDATDEEILAKAQLTRGQLIGNAAGLELPALTKLRDDIDQLIVALRFKDGERALKNVDQQLQSLEQRIAELPAIPTADDAASLAALAKLIEESNQAPEVTDVMQSIFYRPNVVVSVGSPLVQRSVSQIVQRDREINDCILGTRVIGTGSLNGTVTAKTLRSVGNASIELTLRGQFHSQSKGYNGPVTLNTVGDGEVMSSRTLFIDEAGISLAPSVTSASLRTRITSINHPLKIVRKIASKKAAQQKPKADAIARSRLQQQVGGEFDEQVTQQVFGASSSDRNARIQEARTMLARLNLPEPRRLIGSNEKAIFLEANQASSDQFSAINPAPPLAAGSFDMAVQVHESTVDNVASRVLAGRTMTAQQLDRLMADIGRPPAKDGDESESEPFEIDFARLRPIIFEARDQTVRIGLRGTRFKQGERELARPIEITATYLPVKTADGATYLQRQGDVGVDFPGGRRLTIAQVALRQSIQKAFDERFPQTLLDQAVSLPTTLPIASMRGQQLRSTTVDARDGWLSVLVR